MSGLKKTLSSNEGFTLVEMLIVGAVLSIIMVAFTSYMFQQAKQTKVAESKASYTQLKSNVLSASSQSESLSSSENLEFDKL